MDKIQQVKNRQQQPKLKQLPRHSYAVGAIFCSFRKVLAVAVMFCAVSFFGCNSEQLDDCYTNTGPETVEVRQVEDFQRIELYNNVNLVLVPGNQTSVEVKCGKNLLDAIETEVNNGILTVRNTMKCNWVRNYDREITVTATVPQLVELRYEGSGDVTTAGQLRLDSLQLSIWGGAGSFTLDVDVPVLRLAEHYGTADITVKGKALITTIFANSFGPFYCSDLISNIVYIRNNGSNHCYVHALHVLEAEITSAGDIYFSGDPYDVKSKITGSGRLIKID